MNAGASSKIRVLIVDDNIDTQDNLKKMLYFEQDIEVVGTAGGGYEGIDKTKELLPDLVLMDINMPDIDGIRATQKVRAEVPNCAVIMMSVQGEQEYLRRSMVAGASDYLVKPFSTDDLVGSIRSVYEREGLRNPVVAPPPPMFTPVTAPPPPVDSVDTGKVVALFSPKGGVGRTTLAVNLASALKSMTNKRVGLLDCGLLFGDVGVMLNLVTKKSITDLVANIADLDQDLIEEILFTHSSGVRVLLAPPRPEMAELVTAEHIGVIVAKLRAMFDYIVVDTMPSFQDVMLAILDAADKILVLSTPEITALKNMKLFLETTEALGYPQSKLMLVINRMDSSGGISIAEIEANVNQKVSCGVVNDWKLATAAVNHGVPFVISNKDTQISKDVMTLASLIAEGDAALESNGAHAKGKGIGGRFSLFKR